MIDKILDRRVSGAPALVLVFMFVTTMLLAGCGSGGEEGAAPPEDAPEPAPREEVAATNAPAEDTEAPPESEGGADNIIVRLSGTEGTVYAGNYGNLDNVEYAEGLLEGEPIELEVERRDSGFDVISASFVKPRAGDEGVLEVEIISDGEVVAEGDTTTQYGTLNVTWSSGG